MRTLDEFLTDFDKDDNEWWRLDPGDQLNLFDALRQDRDGWRHQIVTIRAQQRDALKRAEAAEAAVRSAHTYCARPEGVCLPIKPLQGDPTYRGEG